MIDNLYMLAAVLMRITAVYLMLWGVYMTVFNTVIGAVMNNAALVASMPFGLIPILGGMLLWAVSRPLAKLITHRLET